MANAVQFVFKLQDAASGPARSAGSALAEVERQLRAVNRAAKLEALEKATDPIKKARIGLQLQKDVLKEQIGPTQSATGSLLGMGAAMGAVAGPVGMLVGKLIELGAAGLTAFGSLLSSAASYAANVISVKDDLMFAFKYITGSQRSANALWDEADALARRLGTKTAGVADSIRELMSGGFDKSTAKDLTAAMADVHAMNPAANVQAIATQIAQMKGAGRVLAEDLKPLLNAGVNDDIFYKVLREMTHTKDQVQMKKLLSAGKVSSEVGIKAILEAIRQQGGGGKLGDVAADKANTTVGGSFGNLVGQWNRLFEKVDASPVTSQLARIISAVSGAIGPGTTFGKAMTSVFNDVSAGIGKALKDLDSKTIASFFTTIGNVITTAWPLLKAFGGGMWEGLKKGLGPLMSMFGTMDKAGKPGKETEATFENLGRVVGELAGKIVSAVFWISTLPMALSGVQSSLQSQAQGMLDAFLGLPGQMVTAGYNIVQGLWDGLVGRWGQLITDIQGLAAQLPASVRAILRIQSPSQVFAEIGAYTAEGFAMGVNDNAPMAQNAMLSMVNPKVVAAAQGGGATAAAGMGANVSITVNVDGAKDPAATAQAVKRSIAQLMGDVFDTVAIEAGAVGAPA